MAANLNTNKSSVKTYYDALQWQFNLQETQLSKSIPHKGERGRNNEEAVKKFLRQTLPKKYSIGTGFLVSSTEQMPSKQTDVVIYDDLHNSPLHREDAAQVFPVEIVYGVMEVKGDLTSTELKRTLGAMQRIRELGSRKHYIRFGKRPVSKSKPNKKVVSVDELEEKVPPRSYIFAYKTSGWKTINGFAKALQKTLQEYPKAFLHGVIVLEQDWYLYQRPFSDDREVVYFEGDSLLRLTRKMLEGLGSMRIHLADHRRYLALDDARNLQP